MDSISFSLGITDQHKSSLQTRIVNIQPALSFKSIQVHAKPGVTVKQALKKAMHIRNLTSVESVVSVAQKDRPRVFVDWNTDTMLLSGREVGG